MALELGAEPLVQSKLLATIGTVYGSLGLYEESGRLHEQALDSRRQRLGDDHIEVAQSHCDLGNVLSICREIRREIADDIYRECNPHPDP